MLFSAKLQVRWHKDQSLSHEYSVGVPHRWQMRIVGDEPAGLWKGPGSDGGKKDHTQQIFVLHQHVWCLVLKVLLQNSSFVMIDWNHSRRVFGYLWSTDTRFSELSVDNPCSLLKLSWLRVCPHIVKEHGSFVFSSLLAKREDDDWNKKRVIRIAYGLTLVRFGSLFSNS